MTAVSQMMPCASTGVILPAGWVNQPSTNATPTFFASTSANTHNASCYGAGVYIIGGSASGVNGIIRSTDGYTWANPTTVPVSTTGWTSAAFGTGVFIIGGTFGKLMSSTDYGITWVDRSAALTAAGWPGGSTTINAAIYANGKFVVLGPSGSIATSTDGITWTIRTLNACNNQGHGLAYSGSLFVAVGGTFSATSADGITWTDNAGFPPNQTRAVVWGNSKFCATGTNGTASTSPDGVNWTAQSGAPAAWATTYIAHVVTWSGTKFYAGGFDQNGILGAAMISSSDGISWTREASTIISQWASPTTQSVTTVLIGPVVSATGMAGNWMTKIPADPVLMTFTAQTDATMLGYGIAYNSAATKAVIVGNLPPSTFTASTEISTNGGVTWTRSASLGTPFTTNSAHCVAWNGTRFATITDGAVLAAYSTDGITWTNSSSFVAAYSNSPLFATAPQFVDWFSTPALFIAMGDQGANCTSPDGITWTSRSRITGMGSNTALQIAFNGTNKYIVVGSGGSSSTSTSLTSAWSGTGIVTGFGTNDISGIAYSPTLGLWAAIGGFSSAGRAATSPDGVTWTARPSFNTAMTTITTQQGSTQPTRLRWHATLGKFVAHVFWGIITSTDGVNWVLESNLVTLTAATGLGRITDSIYTGSKLIMSCGSSDFSNLTTVYTSP